MYKRTIYKADAGSRTA